MSGSLAQKRLVLLMREEELHGEAQLWIEVYQTPCNIYILKNSEIKPQAGV